MTFKVFINRDVYAVLIEEAVNYPVIVKTKTWPGLLNQESWIEIDADSVNDVFSMGIVVGLRIGYFLAKREIAERN